MTEDLTLRDALSVLDDARIELDDIRNAVELAIEELDAQHYPDPVNNQVCVTCGYADGAWPCVAKDMADYLRPHIPQGPTLDD